jgi:hypothetical protein
MRSQALAELAVNMSIRSVEITFVFDEARLPESTLRERLNTLLDEHFRDCDEARVHWPAASSQPPLSRTTESAEQDPEVEVLSRIVRLSDQLIRADDLSAMLLTYIEEAPGARKADAGALAEEIRQATEQLGAIENEPTIKSQLNELIDALQELASEGTR